LKANDLTAVNLKSYKMNFNYDLKTAEHLSGFEQRESGRNCT